MTHFQSWWRQPSGGREVLQVSLPLVVSSLSWTAMTFVDRMFLMWVSGEAMSAAFSASMVWFSLLCLPLGICSYANTFVSQFYGDGQNRQIGPAVWQAVWIALACGPVLLLLAPLAVHVFSWAEHDARMQQLEIEYFRILCWGSGGMLVAQAGSAFYSGRGQTFVVMWVDAIFALLNLALDFVWIFGYCGFPAAGIAGAAYATAIALWLRGATYLMLMLRPKNRAAYHTLAGLRWDRRLVTRMLYYGGPSGLQMLLDVASFTVFVLMVGRLGTVESEATSMAFSISNLAFMPIWGFGMAAGILVGQRLGENHPSLAARATWNTLMIALGYMAVISLLYVVVPELFLWGFFAAAGPRSESEPVFQLARQLLRFVAAYNLFDAVLTVFANAIKGAGDTDFVLRTSLGMGCLLATLSWLAVEALGLSVYGCWLIFTVWVWLLGLIFLWRFRQGKWREMRVIEQVHIDVQTMENTDVAPASAIG